MTLAYTAGLVAVIFLSRLRRFDGREPVGGYRRRLREYEDLLVDLMVRLDTLEVRGQKGRGKETSHPSGISQAPRDARHSPGAVRRMVAQEANGMVEYVLKLLVEGPKTSRQIEALIGRSREHTARMMKQLFETGYVARDSTSKPYAYSITDGGRAAVQGIKVSA